ncbi:hypothetical protein RS82_02373 [Microbacterium trichothecenolyticum]|uniref:Uncharacterized protein n=1 Tax=Microbacterium trichothecenolyticum TaxID=69370 RepID=A0A0M2HDU6_MICTR|nr:hypothetical protein RS82_02373 [Microbacterium trichothecenolyticum]
MDAGAADGFSLNVDGLSDGLEASVDQVVPILRLRILHPKDYHAATLRGGFGLPD